MSQDYYTVAKVAEEFQVTEGAVRDWIAKRKLMAIQPGGPGCAYRIPEAALEVFRSRSARTVRTTKPVVIGAPLDLYGDKIEPVLKETGLAADELLRRMATDSALVSRYPTFATDYAAFVQEAARVVTASRHDHPVHA